MNRRRHNQDRCSDSEYCRCRWMTVESAELALLTAWTRDLQSTMVGEAHYVMEGSYELTSLCAADHPTYRMYCSFYPHLIKSSIVFSLLHGLKRVCSDISDYGHEVNILTQSILSRGYPSKLISEQINSVSHITRTKSMTFNLIKKKDEKRITFITQFHPSFATFLKKANKNWLNIRTDNRFNNKLSIPSCLQINNNLVYNSCMHVQRTPFYNAICLDVKFVHIFIQDAAYIYIYAVMEKVHGGPKGLIF